MQTPAHQAPVPAPAPLPVPRRFRILAALAVAWNLLGVAMFVMQVTLPAASLAAMPADQRELYETVPAWITAAFAVAVLAGTLGSILLLLRQRLAVPVLALSLAGLLVQLGGTYLATDAMRVYGAAGLVLPLLLLAIAVALVVIARNARARGWLR